MSEENNMPPEFLAQLKDVPAASDAVRDNHIAQALHGVTPIAKRRFSPLAVAAAVVLALGLGNTLLAQTGSPETPMAVGHAIARVLPPKNMSPTGTVAGFPHSCSDPQSTVVGWYTMDTNPLQVVLTSTHVEFTNNYTCGVAARLALPASTPAADLAVCQQSMPPNETLLSEFTHRATPYEVRASATELLLFSCATDRVVARTLHPDYNNVVD